MFVQKVPRNLSVFERVKNNLQLLSSNDYQHIIKVTESFYDLQDELLYTITERFEGNYLLREIANIQEYNEIVVKEIIKQILKILKTCFSQGYVVDHIKPENLILVKFGQTNYKIKLFFSDPSQYTESDMTPPSSSQDVFRSPEKAGRKQDALQAP